jgi:peptide/nickel transport system substrate-binding protein
MKCVSLFSRIAVALALFASLVSSVAAQRTELTIGITQFPATLHPNIESMVAKSYVLGMTQRPFTAYDQRWELICMLCERLPTVENGDAVVVERTDARRAVRVRYTIRQDARWGDGTPITTDDVVFTYEVGRHPQTGVANAELYRRIERVEVHDAKSFTLHLDRLEYRYNALADFRLLPAHIEGQRFRQDPATYRTRTAFDTDTTNPGLWFGPYRVVQIVQGSHIVLEPNPTWWGRRPHFRRITVRAIENTSALEANLLSGAIDYIAGELGLSLDQALAFEQRHGARYNVQYKPGLIYEHIDANLDNPILADRRVRHALLHGLDREAISRQLFGGRQPVVHSFVSPLDWIHDDTLPRVGYDPARAQTLLDEAGWRDIRNGFRHNAAGERLTLELMTTAGNRLRETVQQVLQSQWRRIGVEVRIRNEPARVFFGETMRRRQFTGLAMYAWISAPENAPRSTLHSNEIPRSENGYAGQNYPGYRNAEMDRLIDELEVELDRARRGTLWRRIQEIYIADAPVLPLYSRADPFIMPRWLQGIEPTGHLNPTTLWVENWTVRE